MMLLLSFLEFVIFVFSLFFLLSLVRGLSILPVLSNHGLLVSLFLSVYLFLTSLSSVFISFLQLVFGLSCFLFCFLR